MQSVVAHNVHENIGRTQQGGTSLLLFGHLTEQLDHDESGKDDTGLGRWSVMTLKGVGVRTRIVCGYNPCGSSKLNSGTTYQQHRRFWVTQRKDLTCPRKRFHDDLVAQLTKWREEGDQLVVCLDANEDIYKKSLGKSLTKSNGLRMSEVVGDFMGKKSAQPFSAAPNLLTEYGQPLILQLLMPASCRRDLGWGIIAYLWTFRRRVWWALPHSASSVSPPAA